jgi:Arc/MetJ-type ribon-helix-helix transcriptional regulator
VDQLAAEIVEEVRKRGPFLSMSEFVNRQIRASSGQPMAGALQTAIDEARINDPFLAGSAIPVRDTDVADGDIYGFPNPKASLGNPAAGAPGWLNQGDLMRVLEPGATVRGDTFVIRTCGEAFDVDGKVVARAYAEAVVQRVPEYINSADRPSVNVWDPSVATGAADNKRFGRRLNIVSFRWLSPQEI